MQKFVKLAGICLLAVSMVGCGTKNKEVKTVSCLDDLKGAKIGVQIGTTGDLYATDEYGDEAVERYNKGLDAVKALSQNKINAVIIDDQPAKVFVEKYDGLKILDEEFVQEDYAIALAKGNDELKDKLNTAIADLKSNGTFDAIVNYYIGHEDGAAPYEKKDVLRLNGTLKVATNAEFEPYEYIDDNKIVGMDIDMMQAIADELGMEVEISNMEFNSIITSVVSGKADIGCAGLTITEERLQSVDFTDSYYTGRQVVIVNAGKDEK